MFARKHIALVFTSLFFTLFVGPTTVSRASELAKLKENMKQHGFLVEAVYESEPDKRVGARYRHIRTGYVLDLVRIQSVPQAFMWINTPPPTDQGEPHTCEHLLLGKGTKGKYVGSLEEMNLGESSAFTMQLFTCYHFHTTAGPDVFFELYEAKLDAILHPNYSDEEIRREVANMGYAVGPDGRLRLEEKGTVYNEMVRGFESPWGEMLFRLDRLVWGETHPQALNSGGYPPDIRTMTPQNLRDFHTSTHSLNNMGAIVTLPEEIPLADVLKRFDTMFKRLSPRTERGDDVTGLVDRLAPPSPAPPATMKLVTYPHVSESEPGMIAFSWGNGTKLDQFESLLLSLFLDNLTSGEKANLYKMFVNSDSRVWDLGVTGLFGWTNSDLGLPITLILNDVSPQFVDERTIDTVRSRIVGEIQRIANFADNSDELNEFNNRIRSRIVEQKRGLREFLGRPPAFGRRGTGSQWFDHLRQLGRTGGFVRQLGRDDQYHQALVLLSDSTNIWRQRLPVWGLTTTPYAVGTRPSAAHLQQNETELQVRLQEFTGKLKSEFGVTDDSLALARFMETYDRKTSIIDSVAATIPTPEFVDAPPLTYDEYISYTTDALPGGGTRVVSAFSNLPGGTVGLAFNANVIPESLLVYAPFLPSLIYDVGVTDGNTRIRSDEAAELRRKEILALDSYYRVNHRDERVELVVRGSGTTSGELERALWWMERGIFSPDITVNNLSRLRDLVDQLLAGQRNRMKGGEEGWVDEPAQGYWRQTDHLILSTGCFLTEAFHLFRLKWQLREGSKPRVLEEVQFFMRELAKYGKSVDRDLLRNALEALSGTSKSVTVRGGAAKTLLDALVVMDLESTEHIAEGSKDLLRLLDDIPDSSLAVDFERLCTTLANDFSQPAAETLRRISHTLSLLRHQDNIRAFVITSPEKASECRTGLDGLVAKLSSEPSARQVQVCPAVVSNGVLSRRSSHTGPLVHLALVNENTRSSVHYHTADLAHPSDTAKSRILDFLSGRVYGGHGSHSIFTKTIGAGLAYSNGVRANERYGRLWYYAERCPDLVQTIDFVVDELRKAPHDTALADYAVAQAFLQGRAAEPFDERGEMMAEDIADGVTPDIVRRYRKEILSLRATPGFYDSLYTRKERVHGRVLPGFGGNPASDMSTYDVINFVIGPEKQLANYEAYLQRVEGAGTILHRIYPRDFWLWGK